MWVEPSWVRSREVPQTDPRDAAWKGIGDWFPSSSVEAIRLADGRGGMSAPTGHRIHRDYGVGPVPRRPRGI